MNPSEFQRLVADARTFLQQEFENEQSLLSVSSSSFQFFKPATARPPIEKPKSQPQEARTKPVVKVVAKSAPLPKPSALKEESKSSDGREPTLKLEPIKAQVNEPTIELEKAVREAAPFLTLATHVPDDAAAKKIASMWKEQCATTEVVLLFTKESQQEIHFLKNLAKAIDLYLAPAKIIDASRFEEEKKWDLFLKSPHLKLILASAPIIHQNKELQSYYKELPTTSQFFLNEIPLLLLTPFSSYFKTPMLKRSLWHKLCQILKK